jgi:hypothetical protein
MAASDSVFRARSRSLERVARRRQNEDRSRIRAADARTWRAPCQSISSMTLRPRLRFAFTGRARAVIVIEDLGVLEELVPGGEFRWNSSTLTKKYSRPSTSVGRGLRVVCETDRRRSRAPLEERLDERGLAGAGGCCDDVEPPAGCALVGIWVRHVVLASSMSSIQCLTGTAAAAARCCRQPMLAVAISCGAASSNVASLTDRRRTASARCKIE